MRRLAERAGSDRRGSIERRWGRVVTEGWSVPPTGKSRLATVVEIRCRISVRGNKAVVDCFREPGSSYELGFGSKSFQLSRQDLRSDERDDDLRGRRWPEVVSTLDRAAYSWQGMN